MRKKRGRENIVKERHVSGRNAENEEVIIFGSKRRFILIDGLRDIISNFRPQRKKLTINEIGIWRF